MVCSEAERSQPTTSTGVRIPIRILIVTDGSIHFREQNNGFSLSELIDKGLTPNHQPWEDLRITTARRFEDDDCCTANKDFRFDVNPFGIDHYDQVWLFGHLGEDEPGKPCRKLLDSELKILSEFMNQGGGVFATGDHANLGFSLCGRIPRVKSMRKWCFKYCTPLGSPGPGIEDVTRIDTLREGDKGFQFNDQSDSKPQEIRPKYYPDRPGPLPHPLLVNGDFAISVLPDHLHEGECFVPTKLDEVIKFDELEFQEFPFLPGGLPGGQIRHSPEKVAISTSAGGHLFGDYGPIPPVEPRAFDIIVAYDGHQVTIENRPVGRVVVDSSFHHFLDINLKGTDSGDVRKRGFYDSAGNPTDDYQAIKQYYRNIVKWLCPPTLIVAYYHAMLLDLRFRSPLIEELVPVPDPTYRDYIQTGAVCEKLISERLSRADVLQCTKAITSTLSAPLQLLLYSFFDPWLPPALNAGVSLPLLDSNSLVKLFLGAAMLSIVNRLPMDPYRANQTLVENNKLPSQALAGMIAGGIDGSLGEASKLMEKVCSSAIRLQECFLKQPSELRRGF